MKKLSITILALFLLLPCMVAQNTEIINGREFIVHKVKKGETVYGIAKQYEIPQDTLLSYNPSATKGIKTDQVLKFPSKNAIVNTGTPSVTYVKHEVKQGETLYGIAKKYNISIEDIETANPQVKNGLKTEDVLLIPVGKITHTTIIHQDNPVNIHVDSDVKSGADTIQINCDSVRLLKNNFKIALILPFKGNNSASSRIASEFYYGFKVAVDSVAAKMKMGIKLYVMNSSAVSDSDNVEDKYDFDKLRQMDLIIGPLFSANLKPVADFAKENRIPIVSPFTKSSSLLEGNPFAVKITPSEQTLAKRTLAYFEATYPNCNFILVNTKSRRDSVLHAAYYQALDEMGITDTNRVHRISAKNASPSSYFRSGVRNVVIYMNSQEVTVKAFITGFNQGHKGNNISLVGTEGWLEFNNVEADYYKNLNLHIPVATYADYTDSTQYDYFIRKYQYMVKADPTDYSFTGYRIGSDFMRKFFTYGSYVCSCIDQFKEPDEAVQIPFNFYFERKSCEDGWENNTIQILRVEDKYVLKVINY